MPVGIDHIVIAVNNLDDTIADYTAAGFTVTPGGEHKGGASANVLVTFQDGAYFELIAFKGEGGGAPGWRSTLVDAGEGLVDFAFRTNDLDAEVEVLKGNGIDVQGPYPGGRFRPDGQRIDWRNIRLEHEGASKLPFYCFDETPRPLRVPDGEASIHANGVTGVAGLTIVVRNLEGSSAAYAAITGSEGEEITVEGANGARRFTAGPAAIDLVEPAEGSALATYLEQRSEVPYEVALVTPTGTGELATGNTHGARLRLVTPSAVTA